MPGRFSIETTKGSTWFATVGKASDNALAMSISSGATTACLGCFDVESDEGESATLVTSCPQKGKQ